MWRYDVFIVIIDQCVFIVDHRQIVFMQFTFLSLVLMTLS